MLHLGHFSCRDLLKRRLGGRIGVYRQPLEQFWTPISSWRWIRVMTWSSVPGKMTSSCQWPSFPVGCCVALVSDWTSSLQRSWEWERRWSVVFGPTLEIDWSALYHSIMSQQEQQTEHLQPTRLSNKIYSIDQILGHVKKENKTEVKSKSSRLGGLVTVTVIS